VTAAGGHLEVLADGEAAEYLARVSSCPANRIEPELSGSKPMIARMVLDLPIPLRPRSAVTPPARTCRSIP
jgi:hypothetical protein